jgi:hypothetical protein
VRSARGGGAPARGGGRDPQRWRDSADWRATASSDGLPGDRRRRSNAPADAAVGTAAHTPSTGKGADGNTLGLAWEMSEDTLKVGPREVLLPKVKSRREARTSRRDVLLCVTAACWPSQVGPKQITTMRARKPLVPRLRRDQPVAAVVRVDR